MELEPRSRQRWVAIVGEGTPYGATVAPDDFGLRISAAPRAGVLEGVRPGRAF